MSACVGCGAEKPDRYDGALVTSGTFEGAVIINNGETCNWIHLYSFLLCPTCFRNIAMPYNSNKVVGYAGKEKHA